MTLIIIIMGGGGGGGGSTTPPIFILGGNAPPNAAACYVWALEHAWLRYFARVCTLRLRTHMYIQAIVQCTHVILRVYLASPPQLKLAAAAPVIINRIYL